MCLPILIEVDVQLENFQPGDFVSLWPAPARVLVAAFCESGEAGMFPVWSSVFFLFKYLFMYTCI